MTIDPKDITQWNSGDMTLSFTVEVDGTTWDARVSFECLTDHCGLKNPNGKEAHEAFMANKETLRRLASAQIQAGHDALIKTSDWHG